MNILIGTDDPDRDSISLKLIEVHPASKMSEDFINDFNALIGEGDLFGLNADRYFGSWGNAQHGTIERTFRRWYTDMVSCFEQLNAIRHELASWEYSSEDSAEMWRIKVISGAQSGALFAIPALETETWESINGHTIGAVAVFKREGDSYYRELALEEAGLDSFAFCKHCVHFD